jgi:porphobilinogen deaminase
MDQGYNIEKRSSKVKVIRVGTRESALAMTQTEEVVEKLKNVYKDITFEVGTSRSVQKKQ